MGRTLLIGAVGLAFWAQHARAADWSVKGNVSETVELNDNRQLQTHPLGMSYNSYSGLNVDVLAQTPTSQFETIGNLKYRAYSGPGEAGQMNAWDKDILAQYTKQEKSTTYNVFGSYSEVQTSAQQLVETGFSTLAGSTIAKTVGGGLRHDFSAIDTGGLNTTFTSTDFTGAGSTPFTALTTTIDWRHRATALVDFLPSLQIQRLAYEDPAETRVLFGVATFGTQIQLSPRATLSAGVGPTWAQTSNNGSAPATLPNNPAATSNLPGSASGSAFEWTANAQLTYLWTPSLTAALTVSKLTGPTTLGTFQSSEQVSGSVIYSINRTSKISLTGSFSHLQATGNSSASDLVSTVLAYSKQLTREWSVSASYQYIQRNSQDTARSNSILLTVSKDFTVLPP